LAFEVGEFLFELQGVVVGFLAQCVVGRALVLGFGGEGAGEEGQHCGGRERRGNNATCATVSEWLEADLEWW